MTEKTLSNEAHIVDGIVSNFTFNYSNENDFSKIKKRLNERYYPEEEIKEFVKNIKNKVLLDWKGQNEFIDWFETRVGKELLKWEKY